MENQDLNNIIVWVNYLNYRDLLPSIKRLSSTSGSSLATEEEESTVLSVTWMVDAVSGRHQMLEHNHQGQQKQLFHNLSAMPPWVPFHWCDSHSIPIGASLAGISVPSDEYATLMAWKDIMYQGTCTCKMHTSLALIYDGLKIYCIAKIFAGQNFVKPRYLCIAEIFDGINNIPQ